MMSLIMIYNKKKQDFHLPMDIPRIIGIYLVYTVITDNNSLEHMYMFIYHVHLCDTILINTRSCRSQYARTQPFQIEDFHTIQNNALSISIFRNVTNLQAKVFFKPDFI